MTGLDFPVFVEVVKLRPGYIAEEVVHVVVEAIAEPTEAASESLVSVEDELEAAVAGQPVFEVLDPATDRVLEQRVDVGPIRAVKALAIERDEPAEASRREPPRSLSLLFVLGFPSGHVLSLVRPFGLASKWHVYHLRPRLRSTATFRSRVSTGSGRIQPSREFGTL